MQTFKKKFKNCKKNSGNKITCKIRNLTKSFQTALKNPKTFLKKQTPTESSFREWSPQAWLLQLLELKENDF